MLKAPSREAAELDEPELVATLRQLVQAIIVHAPPGTGELAIEITASLSELTLPGPLLKRSSGGVTGGSGGPLHRDTAIAGALFSYRREP
jgi:hypothetical protein